MMNWCGRCRRIYSQQPVPILDNTTINDRRRRLAILLCPLWRAVLPRIIVVAHRSVGTDTELEAVPEKRQNDDVTS